MSQNEHYLYRRVIAPLVGFLKQGLSPEKLAFTLAVGTGLSLCPFVGTTTLTCTLAAFAFRLNLAAIQVVNYVVFPLQLILMVPFIRVGVWLLDTAPLPLTQDRFLELAKNQPWEMVQLMWDYLLVGVTVWALLLVPLVWLIYAITLPIFRRVAVAQTPNETP